jgi:anti-anti-sigma regulatory factor
MRLLTLDLSEVGFCDAAGLAVLIGTQRRATSLGRSTSYGPGADASATASPA